MLLRVKQCQQRIQHTGIPGNFLITFTHQHLTGQHGVQEVQIMQQCSFDRNIVQFYGFCPSPPMLVLEFMEVR